MKTFHKTRTKGSKERLHLLVVHIARALDALVFIGTLSLYSSELGLKALLIDFFD